jgi:hypothetical protein
LAKLSCTYQRREIARRQMPSRASGF